MPASVWSVVEQEGLRNFGAGTLTLKACREGQRYPTPSQGKGVKGQPVSFTEDQEEEACDRR